VHQTGALPLLAPARRPAVRQYDASTPAPAFGSRSALGLLRTNNDGSFINDQLAHELDVGCLRAGGRDAAPWHDGRRSHREYAVGSGLPGRARDGRRRWARFPSIRTCPVRKSFSSGPLGRARDNAA
jgi:hypothetical protein